MWSLSPVWCRRGQTGHHSLILITARQILDVLLDQQVGLDTGEHTNISARLLLPLCVPLYSLLSRTGSSPLGVPLGAGSLVVLDKSVCSMTKMETCLPFGLTKVQKSGSRAR